MGGGRFMRGRSLQVTLRRRLIMQCRPISSLLDMGRIPSPMCLFEVCSRDFRPMSRSSNACLDHIVVFLITARITQSIYIKSLAVEQDDEIDQSFFPTSFFLTSWY